MKDFDSKSSLIVSKVNYVKWLLNKCIALHHSLSSNEPILYYLFYVNLSPSQIYIVSYNIIVVMFWW